MRCPRELRTKKKLLWSTGTGVDVWAMLRAAEAGDVGAVRGLLEKDPSLARCHFAYRTPLYFAVRENRLGVVSVLLELAGNTLGLAVNDTLLGVARERGYSEMMALLETRVSRRGEAVAAAIRERNLRKVRRLLDGDSSLVGAVDERGNQPIHWAVMARHLGIIDELLARGADVNARRFDGARPIQLTNGDYLYRGWRDVSSKTSPRAVLDYLRARGADCDLCTAAYIGDFGRVREVVERDPGAANRASEYVTYYACSGTPLRNAAAGGHIEIVRFLLDAGADPNLPEEGIAPLGHALHMAVCNGHSGIVRLLLERGAHANVPVESSADTLSAAMRKGDAEMVALLASHGASRALHLLAYYGDVVTAAAMLGADSRLADDPDALVNAAEEGQEAFVRLLLRVRPGLARKVGVGGKTRVITELLFADGMDANFRDWLGATPLHHFARRGDVENTRLFLERGARVDVVDEDLRMTPLGWAERFGKGEVAAVLRGNCV